jgi:DNA-binding IclR family transcriptional regulator
MSDNVITIVIGLTPAVKGGAPPHAGLSGKITRMVFVTDEPAAPASRTAGSQTLARGLSVLKMIAASQQGMAIQDVADQLGVHRTIAYRILNTLSDSALIHRGDDNRYRGASGLLALAGAAHSAMRAAALPVLTELAAELQQTVSLLVKEGPDAVALAVVEPRNLTYRISFSEGSRHPLNRGAAGHAISSCAAPTEHDAEPVREARAKGYSLTYGEVEPNMFGLAAPIKGESWGGAACVNLITTRKELAENAIPAIIEAASRIAGRLA